MDFQGSTFHAIWTDVEITTQLVMENKLARIHCLDGIAATVAKQICHVFYLMIYYTGEVKRKVS